MADIQMISGTKRINELNPFGKLSGKEELMIDNGTENTYRITVDELLGYIAMQINAGTLPDSFTSSTNIIVIPEGEDLDEVSRVEGNYYLNRQSSNSALSSLIPSLIKVSPNMGLLVED